MFEQKHEHVASYPRFFKRIIKSFFTSALIIALALTIGIVGYHFFAHLPWIDALLNASMILSGMGPVDALDNNAAKIFASCYAIFSGVIFISVSGILLAPVLHRILHRFHVG